VLATSLAARAGAARWTQSEFERRHLRLLRTAGLPLCEAFAVLVHTILHRTRATMAGGMTPATVVVVEDDQNIADLVELYLRQEGFRVVQAATGERGIQAVRDQRPRMVILDVGLPGGIDGLEVCRRLRAAGGDVPILMLTARDGEIDRVLGLELGADDYLTKPFAPRELVARVKAILRRTDGPRHSDDVLLAGDVEVDLKRREARCAGRVVPLATREFDLLRYLTENAGLALTRRQLLDGVWGHDWYGDERTVDVHVGQLRKKLGPGLPLATVWGVGYRLG
jgi:DNA-binding response OmpR family regulator